MPNIYLSDQAEEYIQEIITQFKNRFGTAITRSSAICHMYQCAEDFRRRWPGLNGECEASCPLCGSPITKERFKKVTEERVNYGDTEVSTQIKEKIIDEIFEENKKLK
jgi:transcriptional regulator CtsR